MLYQEQHSLFSSDGCFIFTKDKKLVGRVNALLVLQLCCGSDRF
jgi:hypothetical protein